MVMIYRIEDAGQLTQDLGREVKAATKRGVVNAAMRLIQVINAEIIPSIPRPPVDQGAYKAGWHFEETPEGADVYNDAPHAPVIEWGARPSDGDQGVKVGRKMIEALAEWLVRKGLVEKRGTNIQDRSLEQEAQRMAWAIAMSMKKVGIFNRNGEKGLGILKKAVERLPKIVVEEVAAEIREQTRST